jgi:hypothetical protein
VPDFRKRLDWKQELANFNGRMFFNLWWIFLDEEVTQ